MSERERAGFLRGYQDFYATEPFGSATNPYPDGTIKKDDWERGFKFAQHVTIQVN